METFFLICFIFGALFTVVSAILGAADIAIHLPTGGHDAGLGHDGGGHGGDGHHLPVLNVSSLLAFLTWFGAAGFLLLRFAGWALLLALPVAILAGVAGALVVARFLRAVVASERVMDPRDYALEGTVARVSVTIPATGVGEVIFSLGGVRRSEAARSVSGHAIGRGTEVVILSYERGVASVQPYSELLTSGRSEEVEDGSGPVLGDRGGTHAKE